MRAHFPARVTCPDWARAPFVAGEPGRPWSELGYRLILPMFGSSGEMESLRARAVVERIPKSVAAAAGPGSATGLVMANGAARRLLQRRAELRRPAEDSLEVWIAEGEIDYLTIASHWRAFDFEPPVFGLVSGSWCDAIAVSIPSGSAVIVATDDDDAGERYFARVKASVHGCCNVRRWTAAKAAKRSQP